jgi:hypothetical protein
MNQSGNQIRANDKSAPFPAAVVGVSLILVVAWSAFSANRLSWLEPAILPFRVIR